MFSGTRIDAQAAAQSASIWSSISNVALTLHRSKVSQRASPSDTRRMDLKGPALTNHSFCRHMPHCGVNKVDICKCLSLPEKLWRRRFFSNSDRAEQAQPLIPVCMRACTRLQNCNLSCILRLRVQDTLQATLESLCRSSQRSLTKPKR